MLENLNYEIDMFRWTAQMIINKDYRGLCWGFSIDLETDKRQYDNKIIR